MTQAVAQEQPVAIVCSFYCDKEGCAGKFVLRVEPAIHRRLAAKALAAGESLTVDGSRSLAWARRSSATASSGFASLELRPARGLKARAVGK